MRTRGRLASLVYLLALGAILMLPTACKRAIYNFRDYPAQPAGISRTEAKILPAQVDSPELEVWVAEPLGDKPVLIYFMGNAGNLALSGPRIQEFVLQGYGFAGMTYRGGGGRPGEPSEAALNSDALRLYRDLDQLFIAEVPDQRRVIYGVSLGTGIATTLAAKVDERAVILETPYPRLCDIAEARYTKVPTCKVLRADRYESIEKIGRINAPLLVQHGKMDEMIPFDLGFKLFEAAPEPKKLIVYPGGNHNDLRLHGAGLDAMRFLENL